MPDSRNGNNSTGSARKPTEYVVLKRHDDENGGVYYTEVGRQHAANDIRAVELVEEARRTGDEPLRDGDRCHGIPIRNWRERTVVIEQKTEYSVR